MSCWDGFGPSGPEEEREGSAPWESEGDLEFLPEPEEPNEWTPPPPGTDPLYDLLKRDALEEDDDGA